MEKHKPHYGLNEIQALVASSGIRAFTQTARVNSLLMGLTDAQALGVVSRQAGAVVIQFKEK